MQGTIELDGDNDMFSSALDEFLQVKHTTIKHALSVGWAEYV